MRWTRFFLVACLFLSGCFSDDVASELASPINSGDAMCSAELIDCAGVCVETDSDPEHCGACGHACGSSEVCTVGVCIDIACDVNEFVLDNTCTPCAAGTYNTAGDTPLGPDTACDADACEVAFGTTCDQIQTGYIKASNSDDDDSFGFAVSLDADTLAIGAPNKQVSTGSVILNPGQNVPDTVKAGAVYVFARDPASDSWSQQALLKASNADDSDRFGAAVSVHGDILAVGAAAEDSCATEINGGDADESDNACADAGAVYVFHRSGNTWSQQAYLKAFNSDEGDLLGLSVAVSDDSIAVGAPLEQSCNPGGTSSPQLDNSCDGAGAVYVFTRSGGTWSQQKYFKAFGGGPEPGAEFGQAIDLDGDTLAVGSRFDLVGTAASGAVYVFHRPSNTTVWTQQAYLNGSNADDFDRFGVSVALSGDTLAVGASWEDSCATGVDGLGTDDGCINSGAVYLFTRESDTWSQEAYLKASNTDTGDFFGGSLGLEDDTLIVGTTWFGQGGEDSCADGIDGEQADNNCSSAGAVYLFSRVESTWTQSAYTKASNPDSQEAFGVAVALSGDTLAVGASREDSCATGINGDQDDNACEDAGAAYVFDFDQF